MLALFYCAFSLISFHYDIVDILFYIYGMQPIHDEVISNTVDLLLLAKIL